MGYYCGECKKSLSEAEVEYIQDHNLRFLCYNCQRKKPVAKYSSSPVKEGVAATDEEQKLYDALLDEGFTRREITLNKKADGKHVDISVKPAMMNIEVDGLHHQRNPDQALADVQRTYYSFKKGWLTIRIPNSLVQSSHLKKTAHFLKRMIRESEKQLEESEEEFD